MNPKTLTRLMDSFDRHSRDVAYVHRRGYRTERWTYGEVASYARRFAGELERRGVGRGGHVMIWGENCAEWAVAFLGCILRGAVAVPMDRIATPDFAKRVAAFVGADVVVCGRTEAPLVQPAPALVLEDLAGLLRTAAEAAPVEVSPDDPVQIVFTSGTTAEPKGVVIAHRNVSANLAPLEAEIEKYLKYERFVHPLRFLNLLPLSHVFGQFLGIFIPPILGATVIFQETLNPSEVISTVKRERVSVVVAVPRLLESLKDKLQRDIEASGGLAAFRRSFLEADGEHFVRRWWRFRKVHDRFGWKFWAFVSGGAALDAETEEFWRRLSFVVVQGYGLTETTSLVSVNHPFKTGRGSIGKILPGREIRLDESGEILVRGEGVAAGYFLGRGLQPVAGQEGWFHTGDVGELDSEGNLYFKGRKKNVIVTAEGMNVYPEDLERALRGQPEVQDCVVVGAAREGNAEACAVLILRGSSADPEAVVRRANAGLAEYQRIRRWFAWPDEDFPRTSTQKPRTAAIQEFVERRLAGKAGPTAAAGSLAELVARITGRPLDGLAGTTRLADDLNLSSIDRVELMSAIEDRYQIDLNESRFSAADTLEDLEQMLRDRGPRRSDYRYPRWPRAEPVRLIRTAVYYLVSWPATMLMTRPSVRGRELLRGVAGPLLIVSNHITQVDIGYVLAALPPRLRHRLAVAMWGELLESMRNPPAEWNWLRRQLERLKYFLLLSLMNVFPLPQQSGFRQSFEFAGRCADDGYSVVVFPEGRRTPDGRLSPFRSGIGMLATDLGLPVLPLRIDGLWELKERGKRFAPPGAVRVTIGAPLRFERGTEATSIARDLEEVVRSLEWSAREDGPTAAGN